MPADQVVRVHLKHTLTTFPDAKGIHGVGHVAIHIPPLPVKRQSMLATGIPHQQHLDYVATAKALIFHHPDLMTKDPELAGIIYTRCSSFRADDGPSGALDCPL